MAGSATGSIGRFFPDIFGGGAPMSGAGASATTSATTGAGSMALGPWMAASAGIQGLAGLAGGIMGQQSAREAQNEANKWGVRNIGFDMAMQDRDMGRQMEALRGGYAFMQSPSFQNVSNQDFRQNFMLSGKFDPYLTAMASRLS